MKRILLAFLLSLLAIGLAARPAGSFERPRIAAVRADGPIHVDGVLDEPDWTRASVIGNFRLILQREGQSPSESTWVRVLFDDGRLYFGMRCENRGPGRVRASVVPRDQILDGDHIDVQLDTYRDLHRAYIFGVNPYGVQLDGILEGLEPDFSWDAVWDAETTRDSSGWTAEMAIPLGSIRFPRRGAGVWGLWIRREITKRDEVCSFPLWREAEQGAIMLQAADLTGLEGLSGGGHLEAEPYVSSILSEERSYSFPEINGIPQLITLRDRSSSVNTGLDLRYPITSTLVANATVNPDYSQVEADAIQVDVNQRFPLFYPEKRPFFLEGAELFSTPLDLVYTRRIADPDYGGKLTGKLGRWSLGAITLRDGGGGSSAGVGAGDNRSETRAGDFHVGRVAYDFGGISTAGLLVAAHRSENQRSGVFPAVIPSAPLPQGGHNLVVAGDSRLRLARSLFFTGQLAWSETRVDSSSDYAGRDIVGRGTFSDVGYRAELRFADGTREVEAYQQYLGPDFRDESGFLQRVDARQTGINSNFFVRPENAWIRWWQPILNGYAIHDHTGGLQEWWVSPMIDWAFEKQTTMHTMYVRSRERWLGRDFDLDTYIYDIANSLWRPLAAEFYLEVGDGIFYGPTAAESYQGWSEYYSLAATARLSPRFTSEIGVVRRRFSTRGGSEIYDIWVLGAKTTFQFTRRLYARVYPQYDSGERHFDADALLAYVIHPGSVLYLGVNGDYDRLRGRQRPTARTVFFKASHRFGL